MSLFRTFPVAVFRARKNGKGERKKLRLLCADGAQKRKRPLGYRFLDSLEKGWFFAPPPGRKKKRRRRFAHVSQTSRSWSRSALHLVADRRGRRKEETPPPPKEGKVSVECFYFA